MNPTDLQSLHPQRQQARPVTRVLTGVALLFSLAALLEAPAMTSAAAVARAGASSDALDRPAPLINERLPAPVLAVARAGNALVAVGPHGLIQRSTDAGVTWKQVPSPVSADLVKVRFRDESNGWAVGHDSVVLHSVDGGLTWRTQLDGRSLLTLLNGYYGPRADKGDEAATGMLSEVKLAAGGSATPGVLATPFFDVLFDAKGSGFVIGAFGMLLHSADNGQTWEPWVERSDNDRRMHLYGLAERDGVFYISGEQGLLLRLDDHAEHFSRLTVPYNGTLFGVATFSDLLLVHGLRGNLFASRDDGQNWQKVETGLNSSLVDLVPDNGRIVVVSQGGQLAALDRHTLQVTALLPANGGEVYSAVESGQPGQLVVTRFAGAKVVDIANAQ